MKEKYVERLYLAFETIWIDNKKVWYWQAKNRAQTTANIDAVDELVLSQEDAPQTHSTV